MEITLTTGSYGNEVSWTLTAEDGTSCDGSSYGDNNGGVTTTCCLPSSGNYVLLCMDGYGDGWNGGKITIDGDEYCGSSFSSAETTVTIEAEAGV
jgi:hypothetical protein